MTDKVKRRLTTVLCADVHGYSRLMETDEAGTLETLNRYRAAMAGLVTRHDGRIVNTWGDAVIAEFASVVEAVQCAAEIQQEIATQESDRSNAHRMRFRIGINLGDVLVDGTDIYGDGVNIAARLQELAEPGGVVISGPVYDQVHHKLSLGFDCLGRQQVKNIAAPVMSYRLTTGGATTEAGTAAGAQVGAPSTRDAQGLPGSRRPVADWLASLPRPIAVPLVLAGFLILVNVFTGLHDVWFHWPVAVLLFIVVLRTVLRRKPAEDRKEER
jgi:adenylate cyclase